VTMYISYDVVFHVNVISSSSKIKFQYYVVVTILEI
jgi:hypothetical protein